MGMFLDLLKKIGGDERVSDSSFLDELKRVYKLPQPAPHIELNKEQQLRICNFECIVVQCKEGRHWLIRLDTTFTSNPIPVELLRPELLIIEPVSHPKEKKPSYLEQLKRIEQKILSHTDKELYEMLQGIDYKESAQYAALERWLLGEHPQALLSRCDMYNSEEYWQKFDRLCGLHLNGGIE